MHLYSQNVPLFNFVKERRNTTFYSGIRSLQLHQAPTNTKKYISEIEKQVCACQQVA